jgi:hypothetical protein
MKDRRKTKSRLSKKGIATSARARAWQLRKSGKFWLYQSHYMAFDRSGPDSFAVEHRKVQPPVGKPSVSRAKIAEAARQVHPSAKRRAG